MWDNMYNFQGKNTQLVENFFSAFFHPTFYSYSKGMELEPLQ